MSIAPIRIVVGEGHPARKGLLRFVLEGEGFDVVGGATTSAELARALAIHQPDVVVLDDGIGATAVQMTREVTPETKIVLVWPGAVVPIGGDARVEPSQVLDQLGSTVERVAARRAPVLSIRRPDWVERVRKDPATLRAALAASGPVPTRPSVTELQRRGQRLHPMREPMRDHPAIAAPAMALVGAAAEDDDGDAALRAAPPAGAATFVIGSQREFNRRLGVIALAGAAVIGAAALSYALSGARITPTVVAEPPRPTPVTSTPSTPAPSDPQVPGGQGSQGNQGGGGNGPDGGNRPDPPREEAPPPETAAPAPPENTSPPPQDDHEPPSDPGPPDPGPPDPGPPDHGPDTPDGNPFVLPSTRPGAMPTVGLPPEAERQLESGDDGGAVAPQDEAAASSTEPGSTERTGATLVHRHKR
jgi:hypothetical protein